MAINTLLTCNGKAIGTLAGRGKLVGSIDVSKGTVRVRIDDDADSAVWMELTLDLDKLRKANEDSYAEIDLMSDAQDALDAETFDNLDRTGDVLDVIADVDDSVIPY